MTTRLRRGRPGGRPRFAVLAAAAVASAVLAVGCGGGDDEDSTASDAQADFIAQADQICSEASARINAEAEKRQQEAGSDVGSGRDVIDLYTEVTIPELKRMFDQIGELTPPPGDEEQVEQILDAADEALREANQKPASLAKPGGQGNPFDEVNGLEQDYGFEVCGGGNA